MDIDPRIEGREQVLKLILEAISRARKLLAEILVDESKIRKIELIWRIYFDVEFSVGLGRFLVRNANAFVGKYRKVVVSKKNDLLSMPLAQLKERIRAIDSELECALYDFETSPSERGLEFGRKARDELKMLILGSTKAPGKIKD